MRSETASILFKASLSKEKRILRTWDSVLVTEQEKKEMEGEVGFSCLECLLGASAYPGSFSGWVNSRLASNLLSLFLLNLPLPRFIICSMRITLPFILSWGRGWEEIDRVWKGLSNPLRKITPKTLIVEPDVPGHFNSNLKTAKSADQTESQLPWSSSILTSQKFSSWES